MTQLHRLPALPLSATRSLADAQARWLDARIPDTPRPDEGGCITCLGRRRFRWYADDTRDPERVVEYECRHADSDAGSCSDQYSLHRLLGNAGVGREYQRLGWADVQGAPQDAVELVREYSENAAKYVNAGTGLILHGRRGNGKTLLATLLLKELVALHGMDGYSTTFANLLDTFSDGWSSKEDREWFIRRIRNAGVLLVDDLGREHQGGRSIATSTLESVIRDRTQNGRPTMITSNLELAEIETGYGGNTMSVLREKSVNCEFRGDDWRGNANSRMRVELARLQVSRPIMVS